MIIVALLIGLVLIAAAIRNTQRQLFGALGEDLPAYVVWAAALVAVAAIGFVPGLKTPSRYLMALVITVLILNNYQAILAGFAAVSRPTAAGGTAPATGTAAPPSGTGAGAGTAASSDPTAGAGANPFGVSPGASAFGAQAGAAFGSTLMDAANGFGAYLAGGGQ